MQSVGGLGRRLHLRALGFLRRCPKAETPEFSGRAPPGLPLQRGEMAPRERGNGWSRTEPAGIRLGPPPRSPGARLEAADPGRAASRAPRTGPAPAPWSGHAPRVPPGASPVEPVNGGPRRRDSRAALCGARKQLKRNPTSLSQSIPGNCSLMKRRANVRRGSEKTRDEKHQLGIFPYKYFRINQVLNA